MIPAKEGLEEFEQVRSSPEVNICSNSPSPTFPLSTEFIFYT